MKATHHRHISTAWFQCIALVAASALLVLFAAPDRASTSDSALLLPDPGVTPGYGELRSVLVKRGKGLDKGTFDIMQVHSPLATAWVWVEDDTIDGMGVEYWAVHPSFIAPGPGANHVELTYRYRAEVNHQSLAEFLDWVVTTNPHVNDPGELQVSRSTATPIS